VTVYARNRAPADLHERLALAAYWSGLPKKPRRDGVDPETQQPPPVIALSRLLEELRRRREAREVEAFKRARGMGGTASAEVRR
jgi:hypothetical protein